MRTLTPIISIVIAFAIFFAFAKPIFTDIRLLQSTNERIEEQIAQKQSLDKTVNELLALKNSHSSADIEKLNALVPESIDEVKVLTDLDDRARFRNLLLGNVSISKSAMGQVPASGAGGNAESASAPSDSGVDFNFVTTDISFELIGTYEQFKAFLEDLERSLVLMEVTNISFSAGEGMLQQYALTVRTHALPTSVQ